MNTAISVAAVAVVVIFAVWGLGWWLRGQFQKVKENTDTRHEDNQKQFSRIYVALAELGWRNGRRPHAPE